MFVSRPVAVTTLFLVRASNALSHGTVRVREGGDWKDGERERKKGRLSERDGHKE